MDRAGLPPLSAGFVHVPALIRNNHGQRACRTARRRNVAPLAGDGAEEMSCPHEYAIAGRMLMGLL
jgi:hypothetical protein